VDQLFDDSTSLLNVVDVNTTDSSVLHVYFFKTVNVVTDYGKDIQYFNVKNKTFVFVDHLFDDLPYILKRWWR